MLRAVIQRLVLFHYDQGSRAGAVIESLANRYNFKGYLQCDGFAGYGLLWETDKITKSINCEIGIFLVALDKKSVKGLKPKQRLRGRSFCELYLLVSMLSYRDTADMLNRVLHRDECNSVNTSTLEDWLESHGESLSEDYMFKAEEFLDSYDV